jgi:hypothetical protein
MKPKRIQTLPLLTAWMVGLLAFVGAGAAASMSVPGSAFSLRSEPLSVSDAQSAVDYVLPLPTYLPADATLSAAYLLIPSHETMFPSSDPVERLRSIQADRTRPVGVYFTSPSGDFMLFVAGISWSSDDPQAPAGRPYGLDAVTGSHEWLGGTPFVVRRDFSAKLPWRPDSPQRVSSLSWEFDTLQWRGAGRVLKSVVTIIGTVREEEMVRIANSVQ